MAYSDYLAIKKQRIQNTYAVASMNSNPLKNSNAQRIASIRTKNDQYCTLQNTSILDEDGELLQKQRFNIDLLPPMCASLIKKGTAPKIYSRNKNALASGFSDMYSTPRIHTPAYIKNVYQPAFCWSCNKPFNDKFDKITTHYIPCSICSGSMYSITSYAPKESK
jgi:hypothetical protein